MKIFLCKTYDGIEAYLKSNTFPNPPVSVYALQQEIIYPRLR